MSLFSNSASSFNFGGNDATKVSGGSLFPSSPSQNPQIGSTGSTPFGFSINSQFGSGTLGLDSSTSRFPSTPSGNPSGSLMNHSRSTLGLSHIAHDSPQFMERSNTPSWVKNNERRVVPGHLSLKSKSSFASSTDRPSGGNRRTSMTMAQSPPNSFGGQSFGTPKPFQSRRVNHFGPDDLPPTESIYDVGLSPYTTDAKSARREGRQSHVNSDLRRQTSIRSNFATNNLSSLNKQEQGSEPQTVPRSVIVFGFPPSLATAIIDHFARFGTILEKFEMSNGRSPSKDSGQTPILSGRNWLRITYEDPSSAERALAENGTMIAGYAIGCVPLDSSNYQEYGNASENSIIANISSPTDTDESQVMDIDSVPPLGSITNSLYSQPPPIPSTPTFQDRAVPRTISMPALQANKSGRKAELKDGQSIFNTKHKQLRFAPSMANIQRPAEPKLKSGKQGWLSWATKKAEELVFGWDDL